MKLLDDLAQSVGSKKEAELKRQGDHAVVLIRKLFGDEALSDPSVRYVFDYERKVIYLDQGRERITFKWQLQRLRKWPLIS